MSVPESERPRTTGRFFTSIRRIPIMVGKAGNTRLPGGPYTVTQFVAGGLTLIVGWNTMSLWGPLLGTFPLVRIFGLLGMSIAALWLSGQLPSTRRKLHHLAFDTVGAAASSSVGTLNGQPLRIPKPHRVKGKVLIAGAVPATARHQSPTTPIPEPAIAPAPAAETPAVPAPVLTPSTSPHFTSGLDRLLEQARTKES